MPETPDKPRSGATGLLLAVPLLACCGLPLLIGAAAALGAAVVAPAAGAVVFAGAVAYLLIRRRRAAACCVPDQGRAAPSGPAAASRNGKAPTLHAGGSRSRSRTLQG